MDLAIVRLNVEACADPDRRQARGNKRPGLLGRPREGQLDRVHPRSVSIGGQV
jgi:hypothetical protein